MNWPILNVCTYVYVCEFTYTCAHTGKVLFLLAKDLGMELLDHMTSIYLLKKLLKYLPECLCNFTPK